MAYFLGHPVNQFVQSGAG